MAPSMNWSPMRQPLPFFSTTNPRHPTTQTLLSCRETTAAWAVRPPRAVKIPAAAASPAMSAVELSVRIKIGEPPAYAAFTGAGMHPEGAAAIAEKARSIAEADSAGRIVEGICGGTTLQGKATTGRLGARNVTFATMEAARRNCELVHRVKGPSATDRQSELRSTRSDWSNSRGGSATRRRR